jgi:hypothetical protein
MYGMECSREEFYLVVQFLLFFTAFSAWVVMAVGLIGLDAHYTMDAWRAIVVT